LTLWLADRVVPAGGGEAVLNILQYGVRFDAMLLALLLLPVVPLTLLMAVQRRLLACCCSRVLRNQWDETR